MEVRKQCIEFIESIKIPDNLPLVDEQRMVTDLFQYCSKITPTNLYRYRSCNEQHISAFEKDQILLTSPTLFNDPYDSLLYINRKSLLETLKDKSAVNIGQKLVSDIEFRTEQEEIFGKEFIANILLNQMSDEEYEINRVRSYDFHSRFLDSLISMTLKKLKQTSHIGCFSEVNNSIIMWSHYANNHSGFVLNYDFNSMFEMEVTIKNKKYYTSHFLDKLIFPVNYSKKRYDATQYIDYHMVYNFLKREDINKDIPFFDKLFYYKTLLHKSTDWEYEREWRIIKLNSDFTNDKVQKVELVNYMRPKDIYIGHNTSDNDKNRLIEISKRKNIRVHQMFLELFESEYKLSSKRII